MSTTKTPTIEEIVKAVETLPKNTQEAVLHEMLEVVQDFAAPVRSPEDQAIIEQRTRELALKVIRAKELDDTDTVLKSSIAYKIVNAMRQQWKRGRVQRLAKRKGVIVWSIPT